jgi:hypothetical protein
MSLLGPLAAILGIEAESIIARTRAMMIAYVLMGLFAIVGIGFLLGAGYMALADVLSPIIAALIFGGVFLLLALAVYLGTMVGEGKRRKVAAERRRSNEAGAFLTTAALTAIPAVMRSPLIVRLGLPAAAIAAFAFMRDTRHDD